MDTVRSIHEELQQLTLENQSLYRTIGAIASVVGGEVRIPRDIDAVLKDKRLKTDLDEVTNEFVFRVVAIAPVEDLSVIAVPTPQIIIP